MACESEPLRDSSLVVLIARLTPVEHNGILSAARLIAKRPGTRKKDTRIVRIHQMSEVDYPHTLVSA